MNTGDGAAVRAGPGFEEITFAAPGPGAWELDATHRGRRPLSPFLRDTLTREGTAGTSVLVERYGLPLEGMRVELVHGCVYMRPTGLGEGPTPKPPPPKLMMKLVVRLLPTMRRRNRVAAQAWSERRWRHEVDRWFDHERAEIVAMNLELQRIDLAALEAEDLLTQVRALLQHFGTQARLNFETHGGDLMPVGDFLAHCRRWGIADADATTLLQGSSPATIETAKLLAPVARAIADADHSPNSVQAVRALDPDAAAAVDSWLELHGWRLVTTDDIDKPTLAERPTCSSPHCSPRPTNTKPSGLRPIPRAFGARF